MTKLLFLGGSYQQLPPIRYAKSRSYHTVVCDYTPDCPAIEVGDSWYGISTTDKDAVLDVARDENIDGIIAYASDPAAPTAAYVAEKMGLPGNPYKSVCILTHKGKYRQFLRDNDFNCPSTNYRKYPAVVKPVDSSGSKGVSIIHNSKEWPKAYSRAATFSRCNGVIVEEFIKRDGYQIAGDGFVVNGKLVFKCFANEHFDPNGGIVPIGQSFPYIGDKRLQTDIHNEIQRLITALDIKNGALNFDIVVSDGKIYLMEIGPRNGGCLIPEVTKYATGVDMISATVESALGKSISFPLSQHRGFYSSYMIHSQYAGRFVGLDINESIQIVGANLAIEYGDEVRPYENSSCTIGTMILKFNNQLEMLEKMDNMREYVKVVTE